MDTRGEHRFSSLMKQNKKAKICAVFCFAGFFFLKFFCYEVIVKQKIYKRSSNYYSTPHVLLWVSAWDVLEVRKHSVSTMSCWDIRVIF